MLSEPPRCRPVPVRALKGADSPRSLHRGHSPGHMSPPGARSTGGGWLLPASWPDPNRLRQVNPDHDETYRGGGPISCHNKTSRRVPLSVRNACDLLTQIFSTQAAARERAVDAEERIHLGSVQTRLLGLMAAEEHFVDGLLHDPDELMAVARASGAAVVTGDPIWRVGAAPPEPRLRELIAWLSANHREDIFATDSLCGVFPPAQAYADTASGLLAMSISKVHASYILWFRPEVVQTVKWGGDPTKPIEDGPGPARLHPRKSFEVWKEILRHRSLPWKPSEIGTVKELDRKSVV